MNYISYIGNFIEYAGKEMSFETWIVIVWNAFKLQPTRFKYYIVHNIYNWVTDVTSVVQYVHWNSCIMDLYGK